jgi:hypothetical protein
LLSVSFFFRGTAARLVSLLTRVVIGNSSKERLHRFPEQRHVVVADQLAARHVDRRLSPANPAGVFDFFMRYPFPSRSVVSSRFVAGGGYRALTRRK